MMIGMAISSHLNMLGKITTSSYLNVLFGLMVKKQEKRLVML